MAAVEGRSEQITLLSTETTDCKPSPITSYSAFQTSSKSAPGCPSGAPSHLASMLFNNTSGLPSYGHSSHLTPSSAVAVQHFKSAFQQQQAALVSSMLHGNSSATNSMSGDMVLGYHQNESEGKLGMESNSHQSHQSSGSSASGNQLTVSSTTSNEVRMVMLYGVPIVSLVMDGQERLCLAQISNTLLKNFSYNEIHNRRVALGITCVQCTPVQLELLRRAGAMPVSSRRCGMITKREAERLCKSFLAETTPPKLPDTFAFDVYHACAWGCRGSFTPSRYNSSRAKCIKCIYCGLFFSPNKFIFHSHRLPTSKYVQPDAANFNSWRRHIKLVGSPEPADHVTFAWEDVKAMFNGGSRKRAMTSTLNSFTKNQENLNNAERQNRASRYHYGTGDNQSGVDDSDEFSSTETKTSKPNLGSETIGEMHHDESHQSKLKTDGEKISGTSYNSTKTLFEGHLRQTFEGGPLGTISHLNKANELNQQQTTPTSVVSSPTLSSPSLSSAPSPPTPAKSSSTHESRSEYFPFSPTEYVESKSKIPVGGAQQSSSYLPQHGDIPNGYPLLGGPPNLLSRHQLAPGMPHSHPAILSQLLGSVPDGVALPPSLRHSTSLLPPGYVPMAPPPPPPVTSAANDQIPGSATLPPASLDFRHNLAEFMWSMATKAAAPQTLPYNILWSGTTPTMGSAFAPTAPLSVNHSSSSSGSTPTLSPNNGDTVPSDSGNFFKGISNQHQVASTNPEELRKALILHHQQQQRNQLAPLQQFNPSHSLPLLPNLIGHNLRLMPCGNGGSMPSYMPPREISHESNEVGVNGSQLSKSPEQANIFPFRGSSSLPLLDRFSSEMIAARSQLLFDAYHGSNLTNAQSHLFPPRTSMLHPFLEQANAKSNYTTGDGVDGRSKTLGDERETSPVGSLKSLYPLSYGSVPSRHQIILKSNNSSGIKNKKTHKRVAESESKETVKGKKLASPKRVLSTKFNSTETDHEEIDVGKAEDVICESKGVVSPKGETTKLEKEVPFAQVEEKEDPSLQSGPNSPPADRTTDTCAQDNIDKPDQFFVLLNETNQKSPIKLIT